MSAADLRADVSSAYLHADRCDETAQLLAARRAVLHGLLDAPVRLHTPATWDSSSAAAARQDLRRHRHDLEGVRAELLDLINALRGRAAEDRSHALRLIRAADAAETAAASAGHEARLAENSPRSAPAAGSGW